MKHQLPLKTLSALAVAGVTLLAQSPAVAHGDDGAMSVRSQALLGDARRATAPWHDINVAIGVGGYGPTPVQDLAGNTCIDQPAQGAMGIHYANVGLLLDPALDATKPEALIYEPISGGGLRLVGVEYPVFEDAWNAAHPGQWPRLFDEPFHRVGAGNRYGLPPFYALHVWLWQPNRAGLFADWNPAVRCP